MLFLLRENNVQACVFHVECNAAWDLSHHLTVDFLLFMFKFFDMRPNVIQILLCENNVQVCAFHVECNVTRDLTVDFFAVYIHTFPHASTC